MDTRENLSRAFPAPKGCSGVGITRLSEALADDADVQQAVNRLLRARRRRQAGVVLSALTVLVGASWWWLPLRGHDGQKPHESLSAEALSELAHHEPEGSPALEWWADKITRSARPASARSLKACVRVVGRARRTPERVGWLRLLLEHPDPSVRYEAAMWLGSPNDLERIAPK